MTISVIIPCYQHGATLAAAIDSFLAQTRKPDEIVVVDDGSTDATPRVLERYAGRVKVLRQENRGGPAARNRGFAASRGDLVLFFDADGVARTDALERLEGALLARPEAAFAYPSFRFGWKKFRLWAFDPVRLRRMNYVHTAALVRRERFPGFDESLKRFQDWDLWLTIVERGGIGVWVPETLFRFATRRGGISSWLPAFVYRIPWKRLGFAPRRIREYEAAAAVIRAKHHLS